LATPQFSNSRRITKRSRGKDKSLTTTRKRKKKKKKVIHNVSDKKKKGGASFLCIGGVI